MRIRSKGLCGILKETSVDAILLDLALPDSEGLATLERANSAAGYLPIIVLTGLEDEAVAIEAVRKGAQDYLIKGQTGARQLMQTILRAVERKRLERALAQFGPAEPASGGNFRESRGSDGSGGTADDRCGSGPQPDVGPHQLFRRRL